SSDSRVRALVRVRAAERLRVRKLHIAHSSLEKAPPGRRVNGAAGRGMPRSLIQSIKVGPVPEPSGTGLTEALATMDRAAGARRPERRRSCKARPEKLRKLRHRQTGSEVLLRVPS